MRASEYVQLDPLVILARSHDLVLHSRVEGYEPRFFFELTYEERDFFEWGGWLAVRPIEELPYWRCVMRRERDHKGMRQIANAHGAAIEFARQILRERETVTSRDFPKDGPALDHYRGSRPASLALYYLWRTGEAMTHHRERFQRVYARTEAVAPERLLSEAPEEETDLFLARKAVAFAGIGRISRVGQPIGRLLARTTARTEERKIAESLVDANITTAVEVEGWRGTQYVLNQDLERLACIARGGIPPEWQTSAGDESPQVSLLSPLDPVAARGRSKLLFDYDYNWEIYLPAEQVRFGRYALPILWGDRLIGRIDMKLDRSTGTVVVNGLWLEDPQSARDPQFIRALGLELHRLLSLVGANACDFKAVADPRLRKTLSTLANG
ncbi:MAG TPA: crosslink repair DNA glycosylase YcaQ family protein [Tepidiformaceae bacterium]|nr:crosslink repair DNA glycosylase YcaQ family protein [Tepidiformaceae bacterium]